MKSFESHLQRLAAAELHLEQSRSLLREQHGALKKRVRWHQRRWVAPLIVVTGLLLGWVVGRRFRQTRPAAMREQASRTAPASGMPVSMPPSSGFWRIGTSAASLVLPLGLAFMDWYHAKQRPDEEQHRDPMPAWLLLLRAVAPLFRR